MEEAGAKWLHLDVMDGKFVPCVSFGMPVITSLRKVSNLFFDVHLMIEEPERYIKEFKEAGADMLTVHAEACRHLDRVLHEIHNAGMKAGIALNPGTSLSAIEEVLGLADMILIMTVNPGFGGQKFIPYTADKIRRLKKMLEDRNLTRYAGDSYGCRCKYFCYGVCCFQRRYKRKCCAVPETNGRIRTKVKTKSEERRWMQF